MNKFQWIKDPIQDILNQVSEVKCQTVGVCETVSPCAVNCGVYTIIPPTQIGQTIAVRPEL
jgi:hypothetical protein